MNSQVFYWLAAMVIFIVVEIATVNLVTVWFAAGSLAALIVALAHGSVLAQHIAFLLVSAVLLACLRGFVRKYIRPKITATNVDTMVGRIGVVTAAIDNVAASGQVKLGTMEWTARSTTGDPIPAGTQVRVDRIEGVKAFVSPAEVTANV